MDLLLNGSVPRPDDYYNYNADTEPFLEQYFSLPRFGVETSVAALAASLNIAALVIIPNARHRVYRQHIYHILFMNLALTNVLACIIQLLSNNTLYLFEKQIFRALISGSSQCQIFSYMSIAAFLSNSCSIVSTLTMLGFSSVQYVAICKPLHHSSIVHKSRVLIFICLCWLVTMLCDAVPLIYIFVKSGTNDCDSKMLQHITDVVLVGSKVSVGIVAGIYCAIIVMCIRLYVEIHLLRRRLSCHRHENVNTERRTFITTLILLGTFTIFFIPYTVMYLVSLRSSSNLEMSNQPGLIFYMSLLPYLKFLSDPIIYGIRMRGMRAACVRIGGACGGCVCIKRSKHAMATSQNSYPSTNYSLQPVSSV